MKEAKKQKLHSVRFNAKVGLETSHSRARATEHVSGKAALTDMT